MNRKLASLYGAVISPKVSKVGESQVITLSLVSVEDRFSLDGKPISEDGLRILMDCIFAPDITPDGFKKENTEREKGEKCILSTWSLSRPLLSFFRNIISLNPQSQEGKLELPSSFHR